MSSYWRYVYSSVIGTSHNNFNTPCQDSCDCKVLYSSQGDEILVAVASDGAGSAKYSDIASKLACVLVLEEMSAYFECDNDIQNINVEFFKDLLRHIKEELSMRAEDTQSKIREYACTLLIAIIAPGGAVFFQLGDGAIVVSSPDEPDVYNWIFWPQRGEYENTTYFVTDDSAANNFRYALTDNKMNKIALFTDGLQGMALHYQSQTAHSPFFRPLFKYLDSIVGSQSKNIDLPLINFLNSQQVNERTDDDKTLILAIRKTSLEG